MICSCTCIGGSASTRVSSRKRASRTSCQVCGGKKLVENSGTVFRSMVSTVGVELTSVINNDLRWKTISKGNRSASRRPRRPVTKILKESEDLLNKDPKRVEDMPVSESEKLGVTVLGRRFSEKIEHVPIKKRRFLFRSPSPPPLTHSPSPEKIEQLARNQSASYKESFTNTTAKQRGGATDNTISTDGQVLDADRKNSEVICSKLEEIEDFSGISILAAAACSDSVEDVTGSTVEDSCVPEGYSEVLPISNSMAIQSCKTFAHAPLLSNGTDACSYAIPIEKNTCSSGTTNLSPGNLAEMDRDTTLGKNMKVGVADNAKARLTNVPGDKYDETQGLSGSLSGARLGWDLNVVMDAWEEGPCEDPNMSGQANAVSSVGHETSDNSEVCRQPVEIIERTAQPMDDSIFTTNMPENINCHEDARSLIPEENKSNIEVDASPVASEVASEISELPEKLAPVELDSASDNVINLQTETKTIHDQERTSMCALPGSPVSIENGEIAFSHGVTKEDASGGHSLCTDIVGKQLPEEGINGASSAFDVSQQMGDTYVDAQSGGNVCLEGTQDEKQHVPVVQVSSKTSSLELESEPVDHVMCKLDNIGTSQLSPDRQKLSTKDHVVINEKGQEGIVDMTGGEDQSGTEVVSSLQVDSKELSPKLSKETLGLVDASMSVGCLVASQEPCKSSADDHMDCSGKIALEEGPFDDTVPELDESGDNCTDLLDKASELQDGYDSQYEDGELREPYVHSWEEDLGEEGDAEHVVDYGSDNRDTYGFNATDYSDSKPVQADEGMECRKENTAEFAYVGSEVDPLEQQVVHGTNSQSSLGNSLKKGIPVPGSCKTMAAKVVKRHSMGPSGTFNIDARVDQEELSEHKLSEHDNSFVIGDESKESLSVSRMKLSGWHQLPEQGRGSADTSMEIRDGSDNQNQMKACINGFDSKDSIARFGRREIQSRVDRTTSTCVLPRNDRTSIQRNRSNNFDDANSRDVKSVGSFKPLHLRGRGAEDDRRTDSSGRQWGPNRHSPSYYNEAGFVHSGPKRAPVASYYRQFANGSPQAVHQSYRRRGSPSDKDEAFRVHMGNGPIGERNLDRSSNVGRGRLVRYAPRVVGTVSRERYNVSAPDDSISSFHNMHPLHRRDRSFSPIRRREVLRESRSRSRSRTRSPGMWPSPRGRVGPGFRQCCRSPPNFRYEARMDQTRSPHRHAGFGADRLVGFASAPRGHCSPSHTSKWIGERKNVGDHFREHGYKQRSDSSPERLFRRAQRFDLVDSPVRFRQDDYYRPMHPRRFSEMVGTGRGTRYYESDDGRRKHSDKYGTVHPLRHFDADGTVKRFRYDVEDGFEVRHPRNKVASAFRGRGSTKDYVRGIDNRLGDPSGQDREEKDHYRYGRDGKFNNVNSKSFGMGDCEEEIATRRRPS